MSVDMFMKMKGAKSGDIKGEALDKTHNDEILVIGWTWGMSAPTDLATGQKSGRVQIQHLTFKKYIDRSSPILVSALLNNELITEATLTCRKRGINEGAPVEVLVIKFEKAHVAKLSRNELAEDDEITEEITLGFQQFNEDYTQQCQNGSTGSKTNASYSLAQNK